MTIQNEEKTRDTLEFYKNRDDAVHLVLLQNYSRIEHPFRNGKTTKISEKHIVFNDEVLGIVLIYLHEIVSVQKREIKR